MEERAVLVDDVANLNGRYDYVIVGGGTSGLTVADRLTEDPDRTSPSYQLRLGGHVLIFADGVKGPFLSLNTDICRT